MDLTKEQKTEYLEIHLPFRLNCLMAWDIYLSRRTATSDKKELPENKCYWTSELLDPSLEVSLVFSRSLLHFLGLGLINGKLGYHVSQRKDDVQIWDIIHGKSPYPLSNLKDSEKIDLENVIRIANKSTAHLTTKFATEEEHNSMEPARKLVFKIATEYIDGIKKDNLWWK